MPLISLLEHLPVGITVCDASGTHVYRNRLSQELTGAAGQVSVRSGRYAAAGRYFRAGTDEIYPDSELPLLRALAGETVVVDDIEVDHPRRGRVSLSVRGAPLLDRAGRVEFAMVAFADVTTEKLLATVFQEQTRILERERLAEGLHDEVIQLLAAARLLIGQLRRDDLAPAGEADRLLGEAVARLRLILTGLKPCRGDASRLADALQHALAPLVAQGVEASVDDRLTQPPTPRVNTTLREVCEEAIANIARHAQARRVSVVLEHAGGGIAAQVVDDGVGVAAAAPGGAGHLGMHLMRERIARLGGRLEIDSSPGHGTAVRLWVPDLR